MNFVKRNYKIVKSHCGGFIGSFLASLMKVGVYLMKNVLTLLAKTVLM